MSLTPRILAGVLLLLACRGDGGKGDKPARRSADTQVAAAELYQEYSGLRGIDLLEAYAGGVLVTGTVSQATELGEEGLQVWLSVDRGGVALAFADLGAAARQRGVRPGVELRARCQVGGKPEDTLFLTACTLQ